MTVQDRFCRRETCRHLPAAPAGCIDASVQGHAVLPDMISHSRPPQNCGRKSSRLLHLPRDKENTRSHCATRTGAAWMCHKFPDAFPHIFPDVRTIHQYVRKSGLPAGCRFLPVSENRHSQYSAAHWFSGRQHEHAARWTYPESGMPHRVPAVRK